MIIIPLQININDIFLSKENIFFKIEKNSYDSGIVFHYYSFNVSMEDSWILIFSLL